MLGGRADPLLAAHHRSDVHQVIVHHDRQVVGRETIGLQDDLIVGTRGLHFAADQILKAQRHIVGNQHPDDRCLAEAGQLGALLAGHAQAEPVVAGIGLLAGLLLGTHLRQPLTRAPAVVGVAVLDQLVDERTIGVQALGLLVGRVRATDLGALVRLQTEPTQRIVNLLFRALHQTVAVGVFDAQDELSAGLARPGLVEQRHIGGADVGIAGGTGSNTGSGWCGHVAPS